MLTLFTPKRIRRQRGERPVTRPAHPHPAHDLHNRIRYLTDGVELYRMLGKVARGACEMIGMENCRSLEIVLVPISDLTRGRLRAVGAPSVTPAFAI